MVGVYSGRRRPRIIRPQIHRRSLTRLVAQVVLEEVLVVVERKGEDGEMAMEQLERLLFILHTVVSHRGGAKVTKPEMVCQVRGDVTSRGLTPPHKSHLLKFSFLSSSTFRWLCG